VSKSEMAWLYAYRTGKAASQKGKGKSVQDGQHKGKGKGKTYATSRWSEDASNGWKCPVAECIAHNPGGCHNQAWRHDCKCCLMPKKTGPAILQDKNEKVRAAIAARPSEKGQGKGLQAESKTGIDSGKAEEEQTLAAEKKRKENLCKELGIRPYVDPPGDIHKGPRPTKAMDPEKALVRTLGDKGSLEAVQCMKQQVVALQASVAALEHLPSQKELHSAAVKQLKTVQEKLDNTKTPAKSLMIENYKTTYQELCTVQVARLETRAIGRDKLKQKQLDYVNIIDAEIQQLKDKKAKVEADFVLKQSEWTVANQESDKHHHAQKEILMKKIQDLKQEMDTNMELDATSVKTEAANAAPAGAASPTELKPMITAFNTVSEDADLGELPDYEPDVGQLISCSKMHYVLQQWETGGCMHYFTFKQLNEWCETKEVLPLVKELLGPTWELWFGEQTSEETVLPRQAVVFMARATSSLKSNYDASKLAENAVQAKVHYIAMKQRCHSDAAPY